MIALKQQDKDTHGQSNLFRRTSSRIHRAAKSFYADAFGFAMTDFGPTYACTMTGGNELAAMQAD
jgi:hypothetical protein